MSKLRDAVKKGVCSELPAASSLGVARALGAMDQFEAVMGRYVKDPEAYKAICEAADDVACAGVDSVVANLVEDIERHPAWFGLAHVH